MAIGSQKKTAGLIVLVILLIIVYAHAACVDAHNERERLAFECAIDHTHQPLNSRKDVEHIITTHKHKKSLGSRQTRKLSAAVILGLVRGGIIGIVVGADTSIVEGMVTMGTLSGILAWVGERANDPTLLKI